MNYDALIKQMSPELYDKLKLAVEIGRWPDGTILTDGQRASSLQAVIAWDMKHKAEHERIAYIEPREHTHCGGGGEIAGIKPSEKEEKEQTLQWKR